MVVRKQCFIQRKAMLYWMQSIEISIKTLPYPSTCRFLIFSKPIIQPKKSGIGVVNQKVIAV